MSLYKVGKTKWMSERSNSPKVTPLPLGRLRVERRFDLHSKAYTEHDEFNTDKPEDLTIRAFGGYGLLDGINLEELPANPTGDEWSQSTKHRAYKDCRLIDEVSDPGQDSKWIVTQIYETLTHKWEREDVDVTGATSNGLDTLTRAQVARRNIPFNFDKDDIGRSVTLNYDNGTADFTVGQTLTGVGSGGTGEIVEVFGTTEKGTLTLRTLNGTLADDEAITDGAGGAATVNGDILYLAAIDPQSSDRMGKYVTRWAEPGIVSTSTRPRNNGKLTIRTIEAFAQTPSTPSGYIKVNEAENNVEGITTRQYSYAKGEGEIRRRTRKGEAGIDYIQVQYLTGPNANEPTIVLDAGPPEVTLDATTVVKSEENGYRLWVINGVDDSDYNGESLVDSITAQRDGAIVYVRSAWDQNPTAPGTESQGYFNTKKKTKLLDGGKKTVLMTWVKKPASYTEKKSMNFKLPGAVSFNGDRLNFAPGVRNSFVATISHTFTTTAADAPDMYKINQWAALDLKFVDGGKHYFKTEEFPGYLGVGDLVGNASWAGKDVDNLVALLSSDPSSTPTGPQNIDFDSSPYLTSISGTMVYRNTTVTITLKAEPEP